MLSYAGLIGMLKDSWLHGLFWTVIWDTRSVPTVSACPKITVLDKAFPHAIHCNPGWAARNCRGGICQHCIWRVAGSCESHIPSISGSTGTCRSGESKNIWVSCIVTLKNLSSQNCGHKLFRTIARGRTGFHFLWFQLYQINLVGDVFMHLLSFSSRLCSTVKLSAFFFLEEQAAVFKINPWWTNNFYSVLNTSTVLLSN